MTQSLNRPAGSAAGRFWRRSSVRGAIESAKLAAKVSPGRCRLFPRSLAEPHDHDGVDAVNGDMAFGPAVGVLRHDVFVGRAANSRLNFTIDSGETCLPR